MRTQVNTFLNVVLKILKAARPLDLLEGDSAHVTEDILVDVLGQRQLRRTVEGKRHFKPDPAVGGVGKIGGDGFQLYDAGGLRCDVGKSFFLFLAVRTGMGLATAPSNLVLISMSLFMTFYVMSPTFDRAWSEGVQPLLQNQINEAEAVQRIAEPFRTFMSANTRDKDLSLFVDIARERGQSVGTADLIDYRVLVPAFMLSEIRRGFEIGFLIVLPFLVIDMVVAAITMAMGMMMLPPTSISLPFKILFFVLIDGWNLLVGSLVRSFN